MTIETKDLVKIRIDEKTTIYVRPKKRPRKSQKILQRFAEKRKLPTEKVR